VQLPSAVPLDALRTKWRARRDEFARFHASVDGATLCDELLADLGRALLERDDEALRLRDAAALSGYTVDHRRPTDPAGKAPQRRTEARAASASCEFAMQGRKGYCTASGS
jgi:hypothetical protein